MLWRAFIVVSCRYATTAANATTQFNDWVNKDRPISYQYWSIASGAPPLLSLPSCAKTAANPLAGLPAGAMADKSLLRTSSGTRIEAEPRRIGAVSRKAPLASQNQAPTKALSRWV